MSTTTTRREIQRGFGSVERPLTKELWERDSRPNDPAMIAMGNVDPSHQNVDFRRYYDPEYAREEIEKLWMKTWLYACREEDIPEIGDRVPFQVGRHSFFIIRSKASEFKAFYNSCLHRGTKLCASSTSGDVIRCPVHGWEWKVDGSLAKIPSHWDFKAVNPANGRLRETKLGQWGGFIFINADPDASPLEAALSIVPEHLKEFAPERRYTAARFRKLNRGNWKICQEAFMESYHVVATHPEAVPFNGDSQSQYDVWESEFGHIGRQVTPSAVPSMHAGPSASTLEAAMVFASIMKQWHYPDADMPTLNSAGNVRAQLGAWHRIQHERRYGRPVQLSDATMIDSILYFVFPHMTVWLTEALPFIYQFLPHETDPGLSYFEVRMLLPCPEGAPRPPSSPMIEIGVNERIADCAPAFGFLASVFDQDMDNMPLIQAGVQAADPKRNHSQLGAYQEMIIQHWHSVIDQYMAK